MLLVLFQVLSRQPLSFRTQVDIKGMPGIPYHIFEETVMKSRGTRSHGNKLLASDT